MHIKKVYKISPDQTEVCENPHRVKTASQTRSSDLCLWTDKQLLELP